MGVTNQFEKANELLATHLHFRLDGGATEFLSALDRAGLRRFEHCVLLVAMWARPHHKGVDKYQRLMELLRLVTPEKVGKYRNPETEAAAAAQRAMDKELIDVLSRNP